MTGIAEKSTNPHIKQKSKYLPIIVNTRQTSNLVSKYIDLMLIFDYTNCINSLMYSKIRLMALPF